MKLSIIRLESGMPLSAPHERAFAATRELASPFTRKFGKGRCRAKSAREMENVERKILLFCFVFFFFLSFFFFFFQHRKTLQEPRAVA